MYRVNEKREAIRTIQRRICRAPTGCFSDEDYVEIERIRKKNGIEAKGEIDYPTFLAINKEFEEKRIKEAAVRHLGTGARFPYKAKDRGRDVEAINILLAKALEKYGYLYDLPFGLDYDGKTENAVMILCETFGFDKVEYVDEVLYVRLLVECGAD